jgi:hypothetical protein
MIRYNRQQQRRKGHQARNLKSATQLSTRQAKTAATETSKKSNQHRHRNLKSQPSKPPKKVNCTPSPAPKRWQKKRNHNTQTGQNRFPARPTCLNASDIQPYIDLSYPDIGGKSQMTPYKLFVRAIVGLLILKSSLMEHSGVRVRFGRIQFCCNTATASGDARSTFTPENTASILFAALSALPVMLFPLFVRYCLFSRPIHCH